MDTHSNILSKSAKLNFLIRLDQPQKLTVANMKILHAKLRQLEAEDPTELLLHYKPIISSLVQILANDYNLRMDAHGS